MTAKLMLVGDSSIDEAIVEHASAEDWVGEIECMSAEDEPYDAPVIGLVRRVQALGGSR